MKPLFASVVAALTGLVLAMPVAAGSGGLRPFGTGDVSISNVGRLMIVNEEGEFGGVTLQRRGHGQLLVDAWFQFVSTGDVVGDSPRFIIPIDTDGRARTVEEHASISAAQCTPQQPGVVGVHTVNAVCSVTLDIENTTYSSWTQMVVTHPTWRLASGENTVVLADDPGTFLIWYIMTA
jgi:hypothetical protein